MAAEQSILLVDKVETGASEAEHSNFITRLDKILYQNQQATARTLKLNCHLEISDQKTDHFPKFLFAQH